MLDTTPGYLKPEESRIQEAISIIFRVAECIGPDVAIEPGFLVKMIAVDGITTAQAMWAIHEMTVKGGIEAHLVRPTRITRCVTAGNPPAGIRVAEGEVHIIGGEGATDWHKYWFCINHNKLDEIRRGLSSVGHQDSNRGSDFGFDREEAERAEKLSRIDGEKVERTIAAIDAVRLHGTRSDLESETGPSALAVRLHALREHFAGIDLAERVRLLSPTTGIQRCVAAIMHSALCGEMSQTEGLIRQAVAGYSRRSLVDLAAYFNGDLNVPALIWRGRPFVPVEQEPESKSEQRASALKIFPQGLPPNTDLVDLAIRLNTAKGSNKSMNDVAYEFTGGNKAKAQSLLSQLRRMRREGKLNL